MKKYFLSFLIGIILAYSGICLAVVGADNPFNCSSQSCSTDGLTGLISCHYDNCTMQPIFTQNITVTNYTLNITNQTLDCNSTDLVQSLYNFTSSFNNSIFGCSDSQSQIFNLNQSATTCLTSLNYCNSQLSTIAGSTNNISYVQQLSDCQLKSSQLSGNVTTCQTQLSDKSNQVFLAAGGGALIVALIAMFFRRKSGVENRASTYQGQGEEVPYNQNVVNTDLRLRKIEQAITDAMKSKDEKKKGGK